MKLDDVGAVIISYIAYFTMEENQDKKYYYDEYSDRKDSYRKQLVGLITKGAEESAPSKTKQKSLLNDEEEIENVEEKNEKVSNKK